MVKRISFFFLLCLLLSSCGNSWIPLELDKSLGEQARNEIESNSMQFKILDPENHEEAYHILNKIKDQIVNSGKVSHASDFDWEIKIIEDDSVLNAFCLPGGYIFVYTGLIKYLDSEAALAGVLGHEMAHADLRHSTNQMVKNVGLSLAIRFFFGSSESGIVNLGANLLSLSFSRSDETDADMKSVEYLYGTDYDPRGAAIFFEKIKKDEKNIDLIEFASTHPNPDNRVEKIMAKWKALGSKDGKKGTESYQILLKDLP